jgi:hypothetical protein
MFNSATASAAYARDNARLVDFVHTYATANGAAEKMHDGDDDGDMRDTARTERPAIVIVGGGISAERRVAPKRTRTRGLQPLHAARIVIALGRQGPH